MARILINNNMTLTEPSTSSRAQAKKCVWQLRDVSGNELDLNINLGARHSIINDFMEIAAADLQIHPHLYDNLNDDTFAWKTNYFYSLTGVDHEPGHFLLLAHNLVEPITHDVGLLRAQDWFSTPRENTQVAHILEDAEPPEVEIEYDVNLPPKRSRSIKMTINTRRRAKFETAFAEELTDRLGDI